MKPFNAQAEAALRAQVMLQAIRQQMAQYGAPDIIPLSDYADEATFNFLLPDAGWNFNQWQLVNREVGRILEAHGYRVAFGRIELNEYFDFLAEKHLENTPQSRAMFAGLKACPPGTRLK